MKATELRIGNIVFDPKRKDVDLDTLGKGMYRVSSWAIERHDSGYLELMPVLLTPHWLERLGFKNKVDWHIMLDNDPSRHLVIMHVTHSGDEFYPVLEGAGELSSEVSQVFALNKIQYVHPTPKPILFFNRRRVNRERFFAQMK